MFSFRNTLVLFLTFIFSINLTAQINRGPDFFIMGAQKAGTTSLHAYLSRHPQIQFTSVKEPQFFNFHFHEGINWYLKLFPKKKTDTFSVIGDASPCYIFFDNVPRRVHPLFPDVKLILLLRNPVDRAFSHYYMRFAGGVEERTFEQVIQDELPLLDMPTMVVGGQYYLKRGLYLAQIKRWMKLFPQQQLLVISSSDLFRNPKLITDQICTFLGVNSVDLGEFPNISSPDKTIELKPETKKFLQEFYKSHNQKLQKYLKNKLKSTIHLNWD